jgi:hypothetical protein
VVSVFSLDRGGARDEPGGWPRSQRRDASVTACGGDPHAGDPTERERSAMGRDEPVSLALALSLGAGRLISSSSTADPSSSASLSSATSDRVREWTRQFAPRRVGLRDRWYLGEQARGIYGQLARVRFRRPSNTA